MKLSAEKVLELRAAIDGFVIRKGIPLDDETRGMVDEEIRRLSKDIDEIGSALAFERVRTWCLVRRSMFELSGLLTQLSEKLDRPSLAMRIEELETRVSDLQRTPRLVKSA